MIYKSSQFHNGRRGSALTIKIISGSNVNKLTEISEDGTLILNLKSDKKTGDFNLTMIDFLEMMLAVSRGQIEVIAGQDGTEKLVAILDIDPDELQKRIMDYLENRE